MADRYISAGRFVASLLDAPEVIRELDQDLIRSLDRRTGRQIMQSAVPVLQNLRGPSDSPDSSEDRRSDEAHLHDLLRAERVHERWRDCADSMLAATFAARPLCAPALTSLGSW